MTEINNGKLFARIAGVMGAVRSLAKDGYNKQNNYNYISSDSALEQIGRAMSDNGLVIIPMITGYNSTTEGKCTRTVVEFDMNICDADGGAFTTRWMGEGIDYGSPDKALNKAMTNATKYFLLKLFLVGTGEADPDGESSEYGAAGKQTQAAPSAAKAQAQHRNGASAAVATCPHCHAPAGKPHSTGCPNRAADKPPASLDEVDELNPDPHNPFTSPTAGAASEESLPYGDIADALTGDCAKLATWAAGLHANGNGPATKPQYGFLSKTVDKATGDAHTVVLSTLCRRYVNADNPCSKDLAGKLLDFVLEEIPQKDANGESVKQNGKVVYVANPQYKPAYVECLKAIAQAVQAWRAAPMAA